MKRGFVLFAVGVACVACVMTPFGDMPEECVHQAGENEIIHPVAGGVELRDEAGKLLRFVEEKPSCVAAAKEITARHIARRNATNKLQYDGWLDNVGYTTSPKNVGHFESSYTICPTNPTATGQYLYYFIGAENIDNGELSILQPVLAWAVNQWTFCSWNCCPSGQTWQGSTISGLQPGGTYFGKLDVSGGTCAITSQALGQTSLLKVAQNSRLFDWADVTLEVYYATTCSYFATGTFTFSSYSMTDTNGVTITPAWSTPSSTMCSGSMTVSSSKITITHN